MVMMVGVAAPGMKGHFKEIKDVQPNNDNNPLPNKTLVLFLFFMIVSFTDSMVMETKCLDQCHVTHGQYHVT